MSNVTANQLIGKPVYDKELHKVGKLSHLYIDEANHKPTWATVKTGIFGTKENFIPLSLAELSDNDEDIIVLTEKVVITDAPKVEPDGELTPKEQAELYQYYRQAIEEEQPRGEAEASDETDQDKKAKDSKTGTNRRSPHARADNKQQSAAAQDEGGAITRHEEEMRVSKHTEEAGRVRLKKYVVTENATITIPLAREKVRIEREPITDEDWEKHDAAQGPAMAEQSQEVILHEEVPTVQRVTMPKERVRLTKEQEMTNKKVNGEVRKERVDIERDDTNS